MRLYTEWQGPFRNAGGTRRLVPPYAYYAYYAYVTWQSYWDRRGPSDSANEKNDSANRSWRSRPCREIIVPHLLASRGKVT